MSKCISGHGEYSEHEPGDWCPLCGVFSEDAIVAERDALAGQLVAAQAVIAEAREYGNSVGNAKESVHNRNILDILAQSPTDTLQAHDRQVAAKAWAEGRASAMQDHRPPLSGFDKRENPYAAIVSAPSTPEQPEGEI